MGNRGSSGRVGGKRHDQLSDGNHPAAKQQAKLLRKQQNQTTRQVNLAHHPAHHYNNRNNNHQHNTETSYHYNNNYQGRPIISSSNDLTASQHHQIWLRTSGAAPGSSSYYLSQSRQPRAPRNRHNQRLHYTQQQQQLDNIYSDQVDDDDDELAYQQERLPINGNQLAYATTTTSAAGGGGGAGSSQTYRSTPLASSSSSSHSTAAVHHDDDHHHQPYEDEDSLYLALDPGDQLDLPIRYHQSHLSPQITTPPTRCLDACCNPPPSSSRNRARTTRLYSQASRGQQQQQRNLQTRPRQQATGASRANMNSNGIKQVGAAASVARASLERGLALAEPERKRAGLLGLLPAAVQDQELQSRAVMNFLNNCQDELGKYVYLRNLKDFNEKLFYFTLTRNVEKLMPLVYTPTVGLACQKFSEIYMRPRGLWVTAQDAGRVKQVVENWPERDVRVIVVTDGERILGLGDLGANGMGISVGKLSLYTALAGIAPANVLPVTIDVGTNNETYLRDPFYIGLRQARLRGAPYESLIEEFMREAAERWGRSCLIQFEDFANSTAFNLLKRYRRDYCTFNDDIQGTASVALAGLITAVRETGQRLSDCNFLFYGAGEANLGTAQLAIMAMLDEGATRAEAKRRIWLVDSKGLVVSSRSDLNEHKADLAQDVQDGAPSKLEEIIDLVKPLAIIGASAQGGAFTQAICQKMAQYNAKPIIFALSNPTSKAECTASQAYEWTQGACVFASGSPFEPVDYEGKQFVTGQGNNAYIFPGVGLAAIGAHTHIIPEETFLVAARALSDQVTSEDLAVGLVYPSLTKIREVTLRVATRVLEYFYAERLATYRPEPSDKRAFLEAIQYDPRY